MHVDRSYGTLSGGEQARVALARALAQSTSTLLLDEPTAALDLHHQEVVLTLTRALAATGVAVVIVLHDLNLAAAYADRIAILANGRLVAFGPPEAVLTADLLTTTYQHPIVTWPNPHTTRPIIVPQRQPTRPNESVAPTD